MLSTDPDASVDPRLEYQLVANTADAARQTLENDIGCQRDKSLTNSGAGASISCGCPDDFGTS